MGLLTSTLFTKPPSDKLERCAVRDADHVPPGSVGDHVKRIQIALNQLSKVFLAIDGIYGPKTAAAVVAFKEGQFPPLRQPGQSIADNIVGIKTVKALDKQMKDFEDAPQPLTGFISLTPFGSLHDHNQVGCDPFLDSEDFQGRISHLGTPINPQRFGKMVCIGGTNEVKYLGFENFVPDPKQDPSMPAQAVLGRPLTSSLPDHSASDICFRSAPIDRFMKTELKRIARLGCRLTYASNIGQVASEMTFLLSLGPQLQFAIANDPGKDPFDINGLHVVVISMLV
jgi:hypothetical protein